MTLEQQLATLESERQSIRDLMEGLREKSLALFDQIESTKDQIADQKIKQSIKPDWEFLLKNDNGTVAYKELKRQLEKFGLETGSYNPTLPLFTNLVINFIFSIPISNNIKSFL